MKSKPPADIPAAALLLSVAPREQGVRLPLVGNVRLFMRGQILPDGSTCDQTGLYRRSSSGQFVPCAVTIEELIHLAGTISTSDLRALLAEASVTRRLASR